MKLIKAEVAGMCSGVREALHRLASEASPEDVTLYGAPAHDGHLTAEQCWRGFGYVHDGLRAAGGVATRAVFLPAEGVGEAEEARLKEAGREIVDGTCSEARRVREVARGLAAEGYRVVVVGDPFHPEARSLAEGPVGAVIVPCGAAPRMDVGERVALIALATTPPSAVDAVHEALQAARPSEEVLRVDTICSEFRLRVDAVRELAERADVVVVVGARESRTAAALAGVVRGRGRPVFLVACARELDLDALSRFESVGVTAGASVPDDVFAAVMDRLAGTVKLF